MERNGDDDSDRGGNPASGGRTELGRFTEGHQFSRGRPRNVITNALRRIVDGDEVAEFLLGVMRNPHYKMRDRLTAASIVYERLEGKAPQAIALAVQNVDGGALPSNWDELTSTQRMAFLDSMPGIKALGPGK